MQMIEERKSPRVEAREQLIEPGDGEEDQDASRVQNVDSKPLQQPRDSKLRINIGGKSANLFAQDEGRNNMVNRNVMMNPKLARKTTY